MKRPSVRSAAFSFVFVAFSAGCGERGRSSTIDDDRLATAYAELAVVAAGDSARAERVLDSLGLSREEFVNAVSEKADDLKDWQAIHEDALRKIDVAALREEHRRTEPVPPGVH